MRAAPPGVLLEERLARVEALLDRARRLRPPRLGTNADLAREARRLRPELEAVVGRPYGRLPVVAFRGRLETRLAGGWSQYLTLGLPWTRHVRMTALPGSRLALPTVLAHELAHRYAFDESVTTLRGLETSARLALRGDVLHAVSARLELARLLLGGAMAAAQGPGGAAARLDAFFGARASEVGLVRTAERWRTLRRRGLARGPDWAATVYLALPLASLEEADAAGREAAAPIAFPRFPLDSLQAAAAWTYTGADALTRRRRVRVPVGATLALWREAEPISPRG